MLLLLLLLDLIAVLNALGRLSLELILDEADDAKLVPFGKFVAHSSHLLLFLELQDLVNTLLQLSFCELSACKVIEHLVTSFYFIIN